MAILSFSILIIMPCLASNKAEINWRDVTARLRKHDDENLMVKILRAGRGLDGPASAEYQIHLGAIFKANPKTYIRVSEKFFKDHYECATWLLINESSEMTAEDVIKYATGALSPDDAQLKSFVESVKRQDRAIKDSKFAGDYKSCR
jgi:hypothetical protein